MAYIEYEWVIETLDSDGNIEDVDHSDSFPGMPNECREVAVVCDDYSTHPMLRSWAYIKDGLLPEYFEDAGGLDTRKVPKKYHKELAKGLHDLINQRETYNLTSS